MSTPVERAQWAAYFNRRALRIAEGTWRPYVTPDKTLAHIRHLYQWGLTVETIAELAGVPYSTLQALVWPTERSGPRKWLRPETEAAVLAVKFDLARIPGNRHVGATGTRRRIQALARIGWPVPWQAQQIGCHKNRLYKTLSAPRVTAGRAQAIDALYRRTHLTPGPSKWAIQHAIKAGWAPSLAWDDIDDPREQPQGVAERAA